MLCIILNTVMDYLSVQWFYNRDQFPGFKLYLTHLQISGFLYSILYLNTYSGYFQAVFYSLVYLSIYYGFWEFDILWRFQSLFVLDSVLEVVECVCVFFFFFLYIFFLFSCAVFQTKIHITVDLMWVYLCEIHCCC